MARYFEFNGGVNVNRIGGRTSVPDDNIAKCMYYLNCVCIVIEYDDDDMEQYTDYENYRWLTPYQRRRVFLLCKALSPDEFEDRIFLKMMTCVDMDRQSWMQKNYYEPMQYLEYEYNLQRRQQSAEQILSEACIIS
ncbi:unnamed protein product [Adineta steineri]|uniref:Uncharacterized protein n=1 Tax=Adineta steineri TaxID=433720 RepID=A0A815XWR6_9BILA|nr:unnamed protein product [Adineta steineri]CAF1562581.1 unnamed protein product [Adineta steineri]